MLQDYLDDRLDDKARAELEALLACDAELAGRVESGREIGRALRDEEPELPPGFYTRARARFEESRRRAVRMPRLLSWEAAGLATAAVLACVLFIPFLLDRDRKGDELPPAETIWEAPAAEQAAEDVDAEPHLELEQGEPEAAPVYEGERREKRAAPPPLPSVQADAAPAEPRREKGEKKGARAAGLGETAERLAAAPSQVEIVPLAPGEVEPGTVIVEEQAPDRRRVLIGTREWPFACEEIEVEMTARSYRIKLRPAADPDRAAEWGCAVMVGNDHRTIEVLPPVEEKR
jgi:hypothetical protein